MGIPRLSCEDARHPFAEADTSPEAQLEATHCGSAGVAGLALDGDDDGVHSCPMVIGQIPLTAWTKD